MQFHTGLQFSFLNKEADKGFYATLGRSVMQVSNQPFNVSSGIIVDMKKQNTEKDEA
jgi:16S rRNA A1518/A1519 N6-dimethyltransferase RsmA/KsgA/DIM1 with predicted DNA glycosylase/AP lyase activity